MVHGEVESIDATKIFCIEHMLSADPAAGGRSEIGLEDRQHRLQNGDAGKTHRRAFLIDDSGQLLVHDRVENDPWFGVDFLDHLGQLLLGTDQRIDVLDRPGILVLG